MALPENDPFSDAKLDGREPPSPRFIEWLHSNAATDRPDTLHHELGSKVGQASPGEHIHDGSNSLPLFPSEPALIVPTDLDSLLRWAQQINGMIGPLGASIGT
jgi:hypothetical protein